MHPEQLLGLARILAKDDVGGLECFEGAQRDIRRIPDWRCYKRKLRNSPCAFF
jgi:hypothetical protein